ncbi:MAG: nitroreductase family protein [Armatimonadota bacterium]|nr:nitroreductase family protein [Armatimonadota bacterium]MDR7421403.1 nitroreductase family protein [Armatimonadota bacterium]MDR7454313.1 nitroreductase family protein [Armatimonadota bacterium]MDR7456659.1 nitroreductase family protein [Armatimonadota bacterium]MDR7511817.1 nitroreductase family protein [Armatimonadota bacterium]
MEFSTVLRRRRMVRAFSDRPVDDAVLRRLLRAAQRAPSAGHTQPLELVVVRDPAVRRELSLASWSRGARPEAGALTVVFCGDLAREAERYGARGAGKYLYMDVGYAALLFMLSAVDAGLACAFIGDFHEEHVQAALGLPPRIVPVGMVIVGHGDEAPRPRPWRPVREIVHYERYSPAYDWSGRNLPPRREVAGGG